VAGTADKYVRLAVFLAAILFLIGIRATSRCEPLATG
jgi:hypothetical protein